MKVRWKMFLSGGSEQWQMWGFRSEKIVAFVLDPSRSSSVPLKTLFNIDSWDNDFGLKLNAMPIEIDSAQIKKLNVDRYSAYKVLEKYGLVQLSYCWAHVRRDFIDIQKRFPNDKMLCKWAEEWVKNISALYKSNNERIKYPNGSELFQKYNQKLQQVLGEMKTESEKIYSDERAGPMNSMKEHWNGLTLFVEYPQLPMDNNLMENGIRPCALGRNNFLGNHSIWGGNLAACMYSIIQTCLLNNINPRDYLLFYFNACAENSGPMDTDRVNTYFPHKLDAVVIEKMRLKKI